MESYLTRSYWIEVAVRIELPPDHPDFFAVIKHRSNIEETEWENHTHRMPSDANETMLVSVPDVINQKKGMRVSGIFPVIRL